MSAIEVFKTDRFALDIKRRDDSFVVLAPGLARALGFRDAYRMLDTIPDEEKGYTTACTPGGDQRVAYVTEAGFYRALGQRQPARITDNDIRVLVAGFQTWVYGEVLPALRRGAPQVDVATLSRRDLALAILAESDRADAAEAKVAELVPMVEAIEQVIPAEGDYAIGEAAKLLEPFGLTIGPNALFKLLREWRWIFGRPPQAYADLIHDGSLRHHPTGGYHDNEGDWHSTWQVRVTGRGLLRIARKLGKTDSQMKAVS